MLPQASSLDTRREFIQLNPDRPPLAAALQRCLLLRCPACGKGRTARAPFRVADRCSECGTIFKREEGFFVGAILINVVTTEAVILLIYLLTLPFVNFGSDTAIPLLLLVAILFPLIFYHHSWSIWLTFDHLVESLPKS